MRARARAVWVVQGDQVRRQPVTVVQVQDGNAQVVGALDQGSGSSRSARIC